MRGTFCQVAALRYFEGYGGVGHRFEGYGGVGHRLAIYFLAMVIVWNAAVVSIAMVWSIRGILGILTRWPDFLLRDCRLRMLGPSMS